jgi:hypothetical protein
MTELIADAYATMAQFRLYTRNQATTDATDEMPAAIEVLALESAARAIDRACGRDFRPDTESPTVRYFTPTIIDGRDPIVYATSAFPFSWLRHYTMSIDDVSDTTGLTVDFDSTGNGDYTINTTAFRVGPSNAPSRGLPYNRIIFNTGVYPPIYEESVRVTADWGWTTTPSTIVNANLLQAARFLKRMDSPFGVAGSPELGNEMRLLSKLDPDVALMVGAFKRNFGAV